MQKYKPYLRTLPLLCLLCSCFSYAFHMEYLPAKFFVYRNEEGTVQQKPEAGFVAKMIPNVNLFKETPGCYIACYSTDPHKGVYPVSQDAYLVGQIRVEGHYQGAVCYPKNTNVTQLCSKTFKCIGFSCWGGGTTGQWFGLK